jgi:Putative Ig domain
MPRLPISRWPKLGTRVLLHFFSAPVLLLAVTIVASAAATDLPDAINGIAYSVQLHFLAVTPITATVPDNVLPKGLLLSPDGLIVGTPVIPSDHDFNFTTTVTDSSDSEI